MDLTQLFGRNLLPLLKYIKENSLTEFNEQLHHINENKETFFSSIISDRYHIEKEAIDFLIEEKYEFFKKIQLQSDKYTYDFYTGFYKLNDDCILNILQHEYKKNTNVLDILSSTGGLHLIFRQKHIKSLDFLFSHNIDRNSVNHQGKTIEQISLENKDLQIIYNNLKKKYFNSDEAKPISETISWLEAEIKNSQNNKEYDYTFPFNFLKEELKKYSREEQEEIISYLPLFKKLSFTNKALSLLGEKLKTYQHKFIPIWDKLDKADSGDLFYHLLEKHSPDELSKAYYFNKDTNKHVFFIDKLSKLSKNMGITHYNNTFNRYGRSSSDLKKGKFINETSKLFTLDFLQSFNPVTKQHNFESLLLEKEKSFYVYLYNIVRLNKQYINNENIISVLNNTLLYKDNEGISNLEKYIKNNSYSHISSFDIINTELFEKDNNEDIFTNETREKFLNLLINSYTNSLDHNIIKYMLSYLPDKDDFNWNNIIYNESDDNRLDKAIKEDLKKIKTHYNLNHQLNINSNTNKIKRKI